MLMVFEGRWKTLAGIAAAFLCLAGLNLAISQTVIDTSPLAVEGTSDSPATKRADAVSMQDFANLDLPQTLVRPVFSPTRRDFVAPVTVETPPAELPLEEEVEAQVFEPVADLPPITLQGTRIIDGKRSALIAEGEATATWFVEGESVAGWVIRSVTVDAVSLDAGSRSAEFHLYGMQKPEDGATHE